MKPVGQDVVKRLPPVPPLTPLSSEVLHCAPIASCHQLARPYSLVRKEPGLHAKSKLFSRAVPTSARAVWMRGHACVLHDISSLRGGQEAPPFCGEERIVLVLVCTPPSQGAEQADHKDHSDTTQSVGHDCVLHDTSSRRAGQAAPPFAG